MNAYEVILNDIVERVERDGLMPWQKSWRGSTMGMPRNAYTGRAYSGINVLLLWMQGHADMRYATYKQAKQAGGHVRKGSKGTRVVYWNMVEKKDKDTGEVDIVPFMRYYTVFNVSDIEGAEWKTDTKEDTCEATVFRTDKPVETADAIAAGMAGAPGILTVQGAQPCYIPSKDVIHMPLVEDFTSASGYAETLLHELTHSTMHESRLDRDASNSCMDSYSREELVAEIGAAFLMAMHGIDSDVSRDSNAAYIKGWLSRLQGDPRAIVYAAAQAQKAVDYILR